MTGIQLAAALAVRLAPVLPEGFSISAIGDNLWLDTPDGLGTNGWAGAVDQDPGSIDLLEGAAWTALSGVQDGVSVTLYEFWPMVDGPGHEMALPGAKVIADQLHVWYGPEANPTILFEPIPLNAHGE